MTQKQETWTVLKVLEWTRGYLADKGVENARLEAEWMLSAVLSLDRVGVYLNFDKPLNSDELSLFRSMVARRAKREPLQYILGTQEFRGLEFEVGPGVLIPRHDTEVLVEEAVKRGKEAKTVLDIGVGSGCIAISIAAVLQDAEVFGVDRSPQALLLAEKNAEKNGVKIQLKQGSLFEPFSGSKFDLIVSNPPYIPSADIDNLQPEVREFEPREALDGGLDGFDFYRAIVQSAPAYLNLAGWLIVEVGIHQAAPVRELFQTSKFDSIFIAKDAAGIERVVGGIRR